MAGHGWIKIDPAKRPSEWLHVWHWNHWPIAIHTHTPRFGSVCCTAVAVDISRNAVWRIDAQLLNIAMPLTPGRFPIVCSRIIIISVRYANRQGHNVEGPAWFGLRGEVKLSFHRSWSRWSRTSIGINNLSTGLTMNGLDICIDILSDYWWWIFCGPAGKRHWCRYRSAVLKCAVGLAPRSVACVGLVCLSEWIGLFEQWLIIIWLEDYRPDFLSMPSRRKEFWLVWRFVCVGNLLIGSLGN